MPPLQVHHGMDHNDAMLIGQHPRRWSSVHLSSSVPLVLDSLADEPMGVKLALQRSNTDTPASRQAAVHSKTTSKKQDDSEPTKTFSSRRAAYLDATKHANGHEHGSSHRPSMLRSQSLFHMGCSQASTTTSPPQSTANPQLAANRRGSWIKNDKGKFVKAQSMWNVTSSNSDEAPKLAQPTRKPVQRTRSRSLTRLDRTTRRGSWVSNGKGAYTCTDKNLSLARKGQASATDHRTDAKENNSVIKTRRPSARGGLRNLVIEEEKKEEHEPRPTRRIAQRTRSRSLTQLDQRNRRRSWMRQGDAWVRPATTKRESSPVVVSTPKPAPLQDTTLNYRAILQLQRTRSRSTSTLQPNNHSSNLNADPQQQQQQQQQQGTSVDYTQSVVWKPRRDLGATKLQTLVRGFLARRDWLLKKPWLQKRQIQRQKEQELARIEREKRSAMLGFKYELEDEDYQREKLVRKLWKEKCGLEKEIQLQRDIFWSMRLDMEKERDETIRLRDRQRTDAMVHQLNATVAGCYQDEENRAKKERKVYKKQVKAVKKELRATQAHWDSEKERNQKIGSCIKAIIRTVREQGGDRERSLADYLSKYTGMDV